MNSEGADTGSQNEPPQAVSFRLFSVFELSYDGRRFDLRVNEKLVSKSTASIDKEFCNSETESNPFQQLLYFCRFIGIESNPFRNFV